MKKTSLTLFVLLLLSVAGYAQGFYFRAGLGYAFPQAGQTMDGSGTPYNGTRNNSTYLLTYNLKNTSFSAGLQGAIGFGYLFNDHIGVQFDADACISGRKYSYHDNNVTIDYGAGPILSNVTVTEQAVMPLVLVPSLVLQTGGKKLNIYSRLGLALPISSKITQDQFIENVPYTPTATISSYDFKFDIKNSFSLGFAAAAGVQYKLTNKLSLWGEVSLLSMSLFIKQSDLTDFQHDGQSYSLSNVTSPHTYYYSKNATVDSTGAYQPAYSQPFSNVAIKVGVNLSLTRRSRHRTDGENNSETPNRPSGPYRRR